MMKFQFIVCLITGMLFGVLCDSYIAHKVERARTMGAAAVYLQMPVCQLTEVKV